MDCEQPNLTAAKEWVHWPGHYEVYCCSVLSEQWQKGYGDTRETLSQPLRCREMMMKERRDPLTLHPTHTFLSQDSACCPYMATKGRCVHGQLDAPEKGAGFTAKVSQSELYLVPLYTVRLSPWLNPREQSSSMKKIFCKPEQLKET